MAWDVCGRTALVTGERGEARMPALLARDAALARRLWEVSARLVGLAPF
jgi:hypothetical protein